MVTRGQQIVSWLTLLLVPILPCVGLYLAWGNGFWWCLIWLLGGFLSAILICVVAHLVMNYLGKLSRHRERDREQMTGKEHPLDGFIYNPPRMAAVETQEYMTADERKLYSWSSARLQAFLDKFAGERFVFNGDVLSLCIGWSFVDEDLNGCVGAALYGQSASIQGQIPPIGALILEYRNGKPCVKVKKHKTPKSYYQEWANQNWRDNMEILVGERRETGVLLGSILS